MPPPASRTAVPTPAGTGKAPASPRQSPASGAMVTAEQLNAAVKAATTPAASSQAQPQAQSLTLHTGRAAVVAGEKASAQLGRVVELTRDGASLGVLQQLDGKPKVSPRGQQSTVQHFSRLKAAVKEFDNAWHDASGNMVSVLDNRKQIFEELLWEHHGLSEAFSSLNLEHSQCQAALPEASSEDLAAQVAALNAAQDDLTVKHQRELQAQREEAAKLKDQLIKAGCKHAKALKLRRELEEAHRKLQDGKEHLASVQEYLTNLEEMSKDTDAKAVWFFPESQVRAEATVSKLRVEQVVDANLPWTAKDHLTALFFRITHMRAVDRTLGLLPNAATAVYKCLWPSEAVPKSADLIA
nr:uncharacterized protein LOC127340256 [Lolium perenne]